MNQVLFPNPFRTEGLWMKGNLHSHTTNSDGLLTPSQVVLLYETGGYDFLSITDHDKLTDVESLEHEGIILLPGEEVSIGKLHLVAFNIKREIEAKDPEEVIKEAESQGGEVIVAHPYWSSLTIEDLENIKGCLGIEVYNATCEISVAKGYANVYWDILLSKGRITYGFAVDDIHTGGLIPYRRPSDAYKGWIMVKVKEKNSESLMESLRKGLFYSTMGPEIRDLQVEDEIIRVKSSPARVISFISRNGLGKRFFAHDKPLTEAAYVMRGSESYVRIEIEDEKGRRAWTNPIIIRRKE